MLIGILLVLMNSAFSKTYVIAPQTQVSFVAKGKPALISIKGEGTSLKGELKEMDQKLAGSFEFDLTGLTTGIDLRDEHLKEKYLEVQKFPKTTLVITDYAIGSDQFKGKLTLRGIEKEVSGTAELSGQKLAAEFQIKLADFDINTPSFQGITVAQDVKIQVQGEVSIQE